MTPERFLHDCSLRAVRLDGAPELRDAQLALGPGAHGLEVVFASVARALPRAAFQAAWKARRDGRATPVLLVALHGSRATLCGPTGTDPRVLEGLDAGQVERLCREALALPSYHAALRYLGAALPALDRAGIPGLRNEGFLAQHELETGTRGLPNFPAATASGRSALSKSGDDLLRALGFSLERHDNLTSILRATTGAQRCAVAVLLQPDEAPDQNTPRFHGASPVDYALAVASRENLSYVVVAQGARLRLHPSRPGLGVAPRGCPETYVEIHTSLLRDTDAAYLWLLFSAEALLPDGTLARILGSSKRFAGELAVRLRERIYEEAVPALAKALAAARKLRTPAAADLATTYRMAMTLLFRLLFLAYAEDKDLLPYEQNESYRARSLKAKAQELARQWREKIPFGGGHALWDECRALFDAVAEGNPAWGVPAYDGGLFAKGPATAPLGAELDRVRLSDESFGPALRAILCIETPDGSEFGPVDFRSLGVREFGTVYEGLLESELALAEDALTLDKDGAYRPAKTKDPIAVPKGEVYVHDRSGARKSSGSYFTKEFAVEHLLDEALEPALAAHLARLAKLPEEEAADQFFDFRVADIAMGSGHFLVAALDRIDQRLRDSLQARPLAGVRSELAKVRAAAATALGPLAATSEPEDSRLLRRLVARRCIYGVDKNPIAVQLARVSIWIHTFVPGLPLSLLDHNLVEGDALVGIGTVAEVEAAIGGEKGGLFAFDAKAAVGESLVELRRLARLADATPAEIEAGRKAHEAARRACEPAQAAFDIVTAARTTGTAVPINLENWEAIRASLPNSKDHATAQRALRNVPPFHFPVAFPEVFLRERAGFDVILGNPPWEKVRVEEHEFWARHFPGLRGERKAQRDKLLGRLRSDRKDLRAKFEAERAGAETLRDAVRGFPGMNTGHPDLFRAFLWRFLSLVVRTGGRIGVVLPGDAFKIAGATDLREALHKNTRSVQVQLLTNKAYWVFTDVDARKLIAFLVAESSLGGPAVTCVPPEFHDRDSWDRADHTIYVEIPPPKAREYSPTLVVPVLPRVDSWSVIQDIMRSPPLRSHPILRVRRVYADFETSKSDRKYWHEKRLAGDWPVYGGEAFDVWTPDTGEYYAFTNGEGIYAAAHDKWRRAPSGSPYADLPKSFRDRAANHPVLFPRLAFRDVTNRTNSRTLVVALIPPKIVTVQTAPWVLWTDPSHPRSHEAYLLGVMSSLVTDWWARRFVEGHFDQEAFASLRVPAAPVASELYGTVVELACSLGAVDERFDRWVAETGHRRTALTSDERSDRIHRLDATVARLYGLSEKQLAHVFETFHEGWDYQERLDATLEHFRAIARKGAMR